MSFLFGLSEAVKNLDDKYYYQRRGRRRRSSKYRKVDDADYQGAEDYKNTEDYDYDYYYDRFNDRHNNGDNDQLGAGASAVSWLHLFRL